MAGDSGTCGFCGVGGGRLGETGDEMTIYLNSTVRTGDTPDEWKYEAHPNEWSRGYITWCGHCVGGLAHMWQRHDDQNLNAEFLALSIWLEMDGIRWALWEIDHDDEDQKKLRKLRDDQGIHMDKLARERRVNYAKLERFRRAGVDLTVSQGWRP
jgi:hypothetical protein